MVLGTRTLSLPGGLIGELVPHGAVRSCAHAIPGCLAFAKHAAGGCGAASLLGEAVLCLSAENSWPSLGGVALLHREGCSPGVMGQGDRVPALVSREVLTFPALHEVPKVRDTPGGPLLGGVQGKQPHGGWALRVPNTSQSTFDLGPPSPLSLHSGLATCWSLARRSGVSTLLGSVAVT